MTTRPNEDDWVEEWASVTMTPQEVRTFWSVWTQEHPEVDPLLTTVMANLDVFVDGVPWAWEDGEMERPGSEEDQEEARALLRASMVRELSLAVFNELLEITTYRDGAKAKELSLEQVLHVLKISDDPVVRFALENSLPVDTWTHIGWFAAWWIQDTDPRGLPKPEWAKDSRLLLKMPDWTGLWPPTPQWLHTWIKQWSERNPRP